MRGIFLGLGSNLGDRQKYLDSAQKELEKAGMKIVKRSSVLETEPLGGLKQPKYLNMVVKIETNLLPQELLLLCQKIENKLGRERAEKWASRTIDIDILIYNDLEMERPNLILPHPGIKTRDFVMEGLKECDFSSF